MANVREWLSGENPRGCTYTYCEGAHVSLTELIECKPEHRYLSKKNIPCYPEYHFQERNVCHVTEKSGLNGVFRDRGFKRGTDRFLWWGLSISDESKQKEFATSPAFQTDSLYGNFRFTFPLTELLSAYSKQHCNGNSPILRVLETRLHKKEINYSVLVHPRYMRHYRKYPRLPVDAEDLCSYREKKMTWRCQSPSNSYEYSQYVDENGEICVDKLRRKEYYVWDNVAVAFHMKKDWVLKLGHKKLFDHLSVCEISSNKLLKEPEMSVQEAEAEVLNLKRAFNL
ncbi:uncharacterized protein LOC125140217 [Tachysurus fulvidraco]|uniref:uncharacterized protein LOC125140217 n=1 Tax=Tachysurus fulvidraco TaxID=1234273 RepID=UPI001FF06965|nr:uncharacterized protein LOC125140217 [Tachysurus fulvidraco]